MPQVGVITIGQTPRQDIQAAVSTALPAGVAIRMWGALDNATADQITAMAPAPGQPRLMVHLRCGAEALVCKQTIYDRMVTFLTGPSAPPVDLWIAWCNSLFPPIAAPVPVLYPFAVTGHFVQAVLPGRKLGIICPGEGQEPQVQAKWESLGFSAQVSACPPGRPAHLGEVAARMAGQGAQAIVLDCMSFFASARAEVRKAVQLPVILPSALVCHAAGEILQ